MAASASLVGSSVPQLPPSFDRRSNRRTLSKWIHSPSNSTSLRSHRLSLTSSLHFSNRRIGERESCKAVNGGLGFRIKKGDALKQYTSILGEPVRESVFSSQLNCTSCCLASSKKRHASLRRFVSGFFLDKSTFHLCKNQQRHAFGTVLSRGKKVQLPHATVGPDEPHATSTTWPHGDTEKQELNVMDLEVEQVEAFLGSALPSHPKLYRGQLKNGLRYLILPNKVPPTR